MRHEDRREQDQRHHHVYDHDGAAVEDEHAVERREPSREKSGPAIEVQPREIEDLLLLALLCGLNQIDNVLLFLHLLPLLQLLHCWRLSGNSEKDER